MAHLSPSNGSSSVPVTLRTSHSHSSMDSDAMQPPLSQSREVNFDSKHPPRYRHRTKSMTGETLFKDHPSHAIMLNIKLGVRYTVGVTSARHDREITMADFQSESKRSFPKDGSQDTPPHRSSDFKFKDIAPLAFRQIRRRFGIDDADYMLSIGGEDALREVPTPGKSGALFYKTKDDRFLIKTISKQESRYFKDILGHYYNHVMMHNDTLLPRFFQLFRIRPHRKHSIRMVVMHNILPSHLYITERYDLKGSTYGRITPDKDRARPNITLKDLDFLELGKKLVLGPTRKRALIRQLEVDCSFMQTNKLMDYSLLVGIKMVDEEVEHERERMHTELSRRNSAELRRSTLFAFDGAMEGLNEKGQSVLIYCGIIDILQEYDMRKQMEHLFKGARHDRRTISAVAPDRYAHRFVDYMKANVFQ